MNNKDIEYITEHLPENDSKWIIIKKLQDGELIKVEEKEYLLKIFDYPTEAIEKEIRSHSLYSSKSMANAKAANDMQKVLDDHFSFINRIKNIKIKE